MNVHMRKVLQEWINWTNTYYSLIGPRPELIELVNKTAQILSTTDDRVDGPVVAAFGNDELEKSI